MDPDVASWLCPEVSELDLALCGGRELKHNKEIIKMITGHDSAYKLW